MDRFHLRLIGQNCLEIQKNVLTRVSIRDITAIFYSEK